MPVDPKRVRDVFLAATEVPDPDRAAYLDRACGSDADMRAAVERLLAANAEPASLLDPSTKPAPPHPLAVTGSHEHEFAAEAVLAGRYHLLEPIGEGGMGTVWTARQAEPVKRLVAVKLIKPGMDSRAVLARFEAERQALALMDHPNIAKVLDGGLTPTGRPFFVMELVKGVPITQFCDARKLSPRDRLELFVSVCQAIQHAHQKGIIHRDLKPSNVLVALYDDRPVVKVIDFGVAKATGQPLTEHTFHTGFGTVVGTPQYMSPEQATFNNLDVDTRSDLYSLGVLLYELLAGSPPFTKRDLERAGMLEMLRVVREVEPPRPSAKLSTAEALPTLAANRSTEPRRLTGLLRNELDWIVMKALEKDRTRRYDTANGFAADVQRYLSGEPVQAVPPSASYRLRKFAKKHKARLAVSAVMGSIAILAVVVLAVSYIWVTQERDEKAQALKDKGAALEKETAALLRSKEQEESARVQKGLAETEAKRAREQESHAKRRFFSAQMNLAYRAHDSGNAAGALDLLESLRPSAAEPDLRGFEWYSLWRDCHAARRSMLRGGRGWVNAVAFSPDGTTLASGNQDGSIVLWNTVSGSRIATLEHRRSGVNSVAFSPDGRTLAAALSDSAIQLWDVVTAARRATLHGHRDIVWSVAFSPDGKMLVSGGQDRNVILWDAAAEKVKATLSGHETPVMSVAFSPDGKTVASATWYSRSIVKVWDVAPAQVRFTLRGGCPVAFLPDGDLINGGAVRRWDVKTGTERPAPWGPATATRIAVSAKGKAVAFGDFDRNVVVWDMTTGQKRTHHGHLTAIRDLAFSPDAKSLAAAAESDSLELWDAAPNGETIAPPRASGRGAVAFSADGKLLTTASLTGGQVWDVNRGTAVGQLPALQRADPAGPLPAEFDFLTGEYAPTVEGLTLSAISPDRTRLAAVGGRTVKVWDVATGREVATLEGHTGRVLQCYFSPNGASLASAGEDGTVHLWDLASRSSRVITPNSGSMSVVAFSPDGQTFVTGGQGLKVHVWDFATGRRKAVLQGKDKGPGHFIWALAFSPDGKTVAGCGGYGFFKLWDVASGEERVTLHDAESLSALTFSPDGATIATGSRQGTVKLWGVADGLERVTLSTRVGVVRDMLFSPDGRTLVAATQQGTVRLWRTTDDPEATARKP